MGTDDKLELLCILESYICQENDTKEKKVNKNQLAKEMVETVQVKTNDVVVRWE